MKKIYRSIAVTVLAALMALPMVVRAEDTRPIIQEIKVEGLTGLEDVRLYVGETSKNVLDRYANITFKAKLPGTNDVYADMKLKAVGFYKDEPAYHKDELASLGVWPFDETQNGWEFNKDKTNFYTVFTFEFKDHSLYKKYQFESKNTDDKNTKLVFQNGTTAESRRTGRVQVGQDWIEQVFVPFKCHIFRKFRFLDDTNDVKIAKTGTADFKEICETELELEKNRTVGSCLKTENEQKENTAVTVKLPQGKARYAVFLPDLAGNNKFLPENTNIMTLGLDETRKANDLVTTLKVKVDENGKIPYIEAQDVTLKPDEKVTAEELIRRAVKKLTTNVLNSQKDLDENELSKVKAFVEDANSEHPFGAADIEAAKALRANGLKIEYRYQPDLGNDETISANAKLFVETAAPNPPAPAPVPQPEQKQQAKTGNAYFDLGRNFLPTCPDSKCAKAGTNAKKDDVPNTAAAANN